MEKEMDLTLETVVSLDRLLNGQPNITATLVGSDGAERVLRSIVENIDDFEAGYDETDDVTLTTPDGTYIGYKARVGDYLRKQRDFGVETVVVSNKR